MRPPVGEAVHQVRRSRRGFAWKHATGVVECATRATRNSAYLPVDRMPGRRTHAGRAVVPHVRSGTGRAMHTRTGDDWLTANARSRSLLSGPRTRERVSESIVLVFDCGARRASHIKSPAAAACGRARAHKTSPPAFRIDQRSLARRRASGLAFFSRHRIILRLIKRVHDRLHDRRAASDSVHPARSHHTCGLD